MQIGLTRIQAGSGLSLSSNSRYRYIRLGYLHLYPPVGDLTAAP